MRFSPHPLTLRQLQYAVAVAEAMSFRRAAERCRVSQPSLSAQIAELERSIGAQLFERDRRRVLVTRAGEELIERARRVLLETEDLLESARRWTDPLSGTLRLGVIPTIGPYLLPQIDPLLRRAFPKLSLQWTEEKTSALVPMIERGELDGALVALESDLGDLERVIIAQDPFVLAASKNDPLAAEKSSVKLRDLKHREILLLDEGHCFREQALELCHASRAREMSFRATSLNTLAQMAAGGAALTLLPELAVRAEKRRGLVIRRFADPPPARTLAMVFRKGTALASTLRSVASKVRTRAHPRR